MRRVGYNRSAKRCKEKWENINKYFKKMKESNKKRREDAKTCPYYQQLDELYSKKLLPRTADIANINKKEEEIHFKNSNEVVEILPPPQTQTTIDIKSNNSSNNDDSNKNGGNIAIGGTLQIQSSNRGLVASFFEEVTVKEPVDIEKELMSGQSNQGNQQSQQAVMFDYDKFEDSDTLDQDDYDDDDEDDEDKDEHSKGDKKIEYKIQYEKPKLGQPNSQGNTSTSLTMGQ